jgi:phospholipid/cholesterol/gamma-HCH transport system substrate-binding protein
MKLLPRRRIDILFRLLVLSAGILAVAALTTAATPRQDNAEFPITIGFADASPLIPGNVIKAAGVDVGEITAVRLQNGKAYVDALVSRSVLPIHTDARAVIIPKDLLGERYINLERGTPRAPVAVEPIVLDQTHTSSAVDLETVLNSLDDPTSTDLAALVTTFGQGLQGQGPQAAAAIKALAPAMHDTDKLSQILSDQNKVLTSLVDTTQPVVAELAAHRGQDLDHLVGSTERTLGTVAADRQAVADALQRLPGTLASAQGTLRQVAGVADSTTPALKSLRPLTDNLHDVDGELRDFADSTDPALDSLQPVLDRAQDLIDEARPVAENLRDLGPDFRGVARDAHKFSAEGLSLRFKNIMEFVRDWSLSTNGYDAAGHWFRAEVVTTSRSLGRTAAGPIPGAPEAPLPDSPLNAPPRLTLPGACGDAPNHPCDHDAGRPGGPEHYGGGPGITQAPGAPSGDNGTGLTPEQENNMFDQVLGGG